MMTTNSLIRFIFTFKTIIFSTITFAQNECDNFLFGFIDENKYFLQSDVRYTSEIIVFLPNRIIENDSLIKTYVSSYLSIVQNSKTTSQVINQLEIDGFTFIINDTFCKKGIVDKIKRDIVFNKEIIIEEKIFKLIKLNIN